MERARYSLPGPWQASHWLPLRKGLPPLIFLAEGRGVALEAFGILTVLAFEPLEGRPVLVLLVDLSFVRLYVAATTTDARVGKFIDVSYNDLPVLGNQGSQGERNMVGRGRFWGPRDGRLRRR